MTAPENHCTCVEELNEKLEAHNTQLITQLAKDKAKDFWYERPMLKTRKIERSREQAKEVVCNCCPICGIEYPS